jgi:putative phage-type endonuclease
MHPQVKFLLEQESKNKVEQRSEEWLANRRKKITASAVANFLPSTKEFVEPFLKEFNISEFNFSNKPINHYCKDIYNFIYENYIDSENRFKGNVATFHGQKFEPVCSQIYEHMAKTKIHEFGLVTHPEYPFLGASPDGITEEGIMIEIKAPFRRKLGSYPPIYYYYQTQLQMACCDLDQCDFIEFFFSEYNNYESFIKDDDIPEKMSFCYRGVYIQIADKNDPKNPNKCMYEYPPKYFVNKFENVKWAFKKEQELNNSLTNKLITLVYYKLDDFNVFHVKRNRELFDRMLVILTEKWKEIEEFKSNPELLRAKLKNKSQILYTDHIKEKNCLFDDDDL